MITLQQVETVEPIPEITSGQFRFEEVRLRQKELDIARRGVFFDRLTAVGTGGLALIALIAAISAWVRTGRVAAPKITT